jgi:hypothetical protein
MIQVPQVVGLVLCDRLDVNPVTPQLSLVGLFHAKYVEGFPSPPQRFTVYVALCDGVGEGIMRLEIRRMQTQDWVYSYERWFAAPPDRLLVINTEMPVRKCVFPAAGRYAMTLLFDGEAAAERSLVVEAKKGG